MSPATASAIYVFQGFSCCTAQNDARCNICGNFKCTLSTKFEMMISELRPKRKKRQPKLFRVAHVFQIFTLTIWESLVSAYRYCRRDVDKKNKTTADFVDLIEVLAFSFWKLATLVTILYGRSRARLNICLASHFILVSAYVSLTIKEVSLEVWYNYFVWKFWLFDIF